MNKRFPVGVANSFPSLSAAYISHIVRTMSLVVYYVNFYIKKTVSLTHIGCSFRQVISVGTLYLIYLQLIDIILTCVANLSLVLHIANLS